MCGKKRGVNSDTDSQGRLSVSAGPPQPVCLAVLSIILSCANSVRGKHNKEFTVYKISFRQLPADLLALPMDPLSDCFYHSF